MYVYILCAYYLLFALPLGEENQNLDGKKKVAKLSINYNLGYISPFSGECFFI